MAHGAREVTTRHENAAAARIQATVTMVGKRQQVQAQQIDKKARAAKKQLELQKMMDFVSC